MNSHLISAVDQYFSPAKFQDFVNKQAEYLVSQQGNQTILIYCKKCNANIQSMFWGVQEKRILQPILSYGAVTHVLFYSETRRIFFIFDRIFIENKFPIQSFQQRHYSSIINKQYKYKATQNNILVNSGVWDFEFEKTGVIIPILPLVF
jgi:hypothetical protein